MYGYFSNFNNFILNRYAIILSDVSPRGDFLWEKAYEYTTIRS